MPTATRSPTLLTGATGFAGCHLAETLVAASAGPVVGISRHPVWPEPWRHLAERVPLVRCDLADRAAVERVLGEVQPQRIFHLAGFADVGRSFTEADAAWAGNLAATRNLYAAIERWGGRPRVLYVGSALVYGEPATPEQLFDENSLLRPTSPYAASKAASDLLSYQVSCGRGLDVIRARPLNHIGPGQSTQFAVANFARQIVAIERGQQPPRIQTGNLSSCRDFSDVRDVVRAYSLLMDRGRRSEVYNVASGNSYGMQAVLERLLALAGVRAEVQATADPARASEVRTIRADAAKLRRETGWAPRFPLDQTLADTLAYWRHQRKDEGCG